MCRQTYMSYDCCQKAGKKKDVHVSAMMFYTKHFVG